MIYKRDMPKCLLAGCKRISVIDPSLRIQIPRKNKLRELKIPFVSQLECTCNISKECKVYFTHEKNIAQLMFFILSCPFPVLYCLYPITMSERVPGVIFKGIRE